MSDLEAGQVFCDACHCKEFNLIQVGSELRIRCVGCQKEIALPETVEELRG